MKKRKLTMIIALFFIAMNGAWGQNPQWELFNQIPLVKRIDLDISGDWVLLSSSPSSIDNGAQFWSANQYGNAKVYFTIYGDYSVSMSYRTKMYSVRDSNKERGCRLELALNGSGMLTWDSEREQMIIKLNVTETVSGGEYDFYNYAANTTECHIYDSDSHTSTYVYDVVFGAVNDELCIQLTGDDISSSTRGTKCFAGGEYRQNWYFHTMIKLANKAIRVNVSEKSQSEINAETSDVYGKWQWNEDRSMIYLKSMTKEASLVIWNNEKKIEELEKKLNKRIDEMERDTTLSEDWKSFVIEGYNADIQQYKKNPIVWGFVLPTGAMGYKTEKAEGGEELTNLMIAFDGGSEQSFSFAKNGIGLEHVQYDRFMGILKRDASILNQIKDKRIMIVSYKQNGMDKSAMFQLEGLEPIYNAITQ